MEAAILEIIAAIKTGDPHGRPLDAAWLDKLVRRHNRAAHDASRTVAKRRLLPFYLGVRDNDPERWASWDVDPATGIELGGNLLFLAGMALFLHYIHRATPARPSPGVIRYRDGFFSHMALAAVAGDLMLSGSPLLRCNMYFTLFLLPGIPNAIRRCERRTALVLEAAFSLFLMLLFYAQTLAVNQLGIVPYRFFFL